jgi:ABC-type lipoprotein release transport system permease subunit
MALPLSYNARNLKVRWKVTLLAVSGIALVVAVFIILVAMSSGFRLALRATGSPDNAILVQRGSEAELTSGFSREHANRILVDDRVARDAQGKPLASPELVVVGEMKRQDSGVAVNVTIRGVSPMAFAVRSVVQVAEGRRFTPGLYEVIVGRKLQQRMERANVGDTLRLQRRDWTIVGVFDAEGSGFESEIWGDLSVLQEPLRRTGGYQSVVVRLADKASFDDFKKTWEEDPQIQVSVLPERKFYEDQAGPTAAALMGLAVFVSVVMGVGAVFGAMNTMYAIVAARTREIGTLRALGFSRRSILFSFVTESVFLAIVGGVLGCILALPANGVTSATGGANFSELAFAFRITPAALGIGMTFAVIMGLVGGLLPATRAARLAITNALRAA